MTSRPSSPLQLGELVDRFLPWGLVVLLAWAPVPFGSNRPWAWTLLGLLAALLLALAAPGLRGAVSTGNNRFPRQLRWPAWMGLLLVLWIVFQCLPWNIFGWHHPLWDTAADALGAQNLRASISVNREASFVRLFRLLTYAGYFLIAWQIGQRTEGTALIMRAVALIGTIFALYGLFEFSSRNPSILWFPKHAYLGDVTSTFINRNSYATFAGLAVIANLVLLAEILMRRTDTQSRTTAILSVIENILWRGKWAVTGLIVVSAALLLSHSRGGMLSTMAGTVVFLALVAIAPSLRAPWRSWFGGFIVLGSIIAFLLSGAGVFDRMSSASIEGDARTKVYEATLSAIRDNLIDGTGLGSFEFIFPMYQPNSIIGRFDFAHNDYLENALELGVPAAIVHYAMLAYLIYQCALGVWRRRKNALYPAAAIAASILVGGHSFVDFSMQVPAVAVTYAALLGIGVAQSTSSRQTAA